MVIDYRRQSAQSSRILYDQERWKIAEQCLTDASDVHAHTHTHIHSGTRSHTWGALDLWFVHGIKTLVSCLLAGDMSVCASRLTGI